MAQDINLVVGGAGPVGCVIAERVANELGWKVLLVEKRNHIAGNCYDEINEHGVLIHKYGPHYFRTEKEDLVAYLSKYTEWIEGNYIVKSSVGNELYDFPINLNTLEKFFKTQNLNEETATALLDSKKESFDEINNSEEFVLSRLGKDMYETFYLGYTLKQWEKHPKDLDKSVCGRIPIRYNRDNRYVSHRFQLTPKAGFTAMFNKMIANKNIQVMLNEDYLANKNTLPKPTIATIYTGPIDAYFNNIYGKLPWRSLRFEAETYNQDFVQPCVQINYPSMEIPYTRTVEIKHVTKQQIDKTTVIKEFSVADGDPYYPIPRKENSDLYERYKKLADEEQQKNKVYFAGRLARYTYINTDEAIEEAWRVFEILKTTFYDKNQI